MMAAKLGVVPAEPAEAPAKQSLADLLAEEMDGVVVPATASLPSASAELPRAKRTEELVDLAGSAPVWCLIGSGDSGKTTVARGITGKQVEHHAATLESTLLMASDPGAPLMASFFKGVNVPPSGDLAAVVEWQRKLFGALPRARATGRLSGAVFDLGADAIAFNQLLASGPTLPAELAGSKVSLIGAYVFTPATDDVAQLKAHMALGVKWAAVALILNLGRADSPATFNTLRRTPEYQAALAAGAAELWWPRLAPQELALQVESRRFLFHEARDGTVPAGNPNPPIAGVYRPVLRRHIEHIDEELLPVELKSWMPWQG